MVTFLSGDHHFGHISKRGGIIQYCNRPFSNIDEMNEALIFAWNKYIEPDNLVYYLGDFTLGSKLIAEKYFKQLNGNIHILEYPWHHDKKWLRMQAYVSKEVYPIVYEPSIVVLEHEVDVPIILCHYQFLNWDRQHYGSLHFFGHSHGTSEPRHNCLDVGIDNAYKLTGEYRPLRLDEACEFASQIP